MTNYFLYDSHTAFEHALTSLKSLNELIENRHQAGYIRHEKLQEWVILGRFSFDSCGNCMKYIDSPIPAEVFPKLPQIMTQDDFWRFVELFSPTDKKYSFTCSMNSSIPPSYLICPECKTGWTVGNCHNAVVEHKTELVSLERYTHHRCVTLETLNDVMNTLWNTGYGAVWRVQSDKPIRNDKYIDHTIVDSDLGRKYQWQKNERGWITPDVSYRIQPGDEAMVNIWTYRHHNCHRQYLASTEKKYFLDIFTEAGFKNITLAETQNEYCRCDRCAPWYVVCADNHYFLIGWRKRVINIEMDSPRIDFAKLFATEETTKGSNNIHAWGRKKCIEYLTTIKNILK